MQETFVHGTLLSSTNEDGTGWQRFLMDLIKITHSIRFSLFSHAWFSFGLLGWLTRTVCNPPVDGHHPSFRFGTMACLSGYFVSQSAFGASEHLPLQQGSTIRKLFPSLIYFSTASWSRISVHLKQTSCIFRLLVYGTGSICLRSVSYRRIFDLWWWFANNVFGGRSRSDPQMKIICSFTQLIQNHIFRIVSGNK